MGDGRRVPGAEGGGRGGEVDERGGFLDAVVDQVSGACVSDRSKRGAWGKGSLPVDCRNFVCELAVEGVLGLHVLDVSVDAARLLEGWDPTAHPGGAACEFVVGGHDGPVEGQGEWNGAENGED